MGGLTLAGWEPTGQGWSQVADLALAFVLSALIGLERERRQHDAGLRTQALVGVAAALFMLVSKHGFSDVLGPDVVLDPSRVAAQIVSGIGFIGGGLIFVRGNAVRGLTTAASVWLTAAVGSAAGAGLPVLAVLVTGSHFLIVYGLIPVARLLPGSRYALRRLRVDYLTRPGTLREIIASCTQRDFIIADLKSAPVAQHGKTSQPTGSASTEQPRETSVVLVVRGRGSLTDLAGELDTIEGVTAITTESEDSSSEP